MQQIIFKYRVVFLSIIVLMLAVFDCIAFENLPPAPVETGFKSVTKKENTEKKFSLKKQISGDFDSYVVFDNSNFNCPVGLANVDGRKEPKYQDDFPMHETFEYSEHKIRCSELYYPYNYRVPR